LILEEGSIEGNQWNWFCKHSVWISKRTLGELPTPFCSVVSSLWIIGM